MAGGTSWPTEYWQRNCCSDARSNASRNSEKVIGPKLRYSILPTGTENP